jgi:hypothetical protein
LRVVIDASGNETVEAGETEIDRYWVQMSNVTMQATSGSGIPVAREYLVCTLAIRPCLSRVPRQTISARTF